MSIYLLILLGNLSLAAIILSFVVIHSHRSKQWFIRYEQFYMQRQLAKARQDIKEQVLTNISNELHDSVGQMLTLARLHVSSIDVENQLQAVQKLVEIKKLLSQSINDVRFLSRSLNAEHIASMGLTHAISQEVQSITTAGTLITDLQVGDNTPSMTGEREVMAFRIVQEALQNVIRHSSATHLAVKTCRSGECLCIDILDNGCGFDLAAAWQSSNGLKNMRTRCLLLGGKFAIRSQPGTGTAITLLLPIHEPPEDTSSTALDINAGYRCAGGTAKKVT